MAAPAWKRMLKWVTWLIGGVLAIPVIFYVALLLINWRDQPPSEAALRLAADYSNRPTIPDADNGYVYVMGFSVAPDADPREAGLQRIEWIRTLPPDVKYPPSGDPAVAFVEYRSSRSPTVQKIVEVCRWGSVDCSAALDGSDDELRAWITSERWLLDRYLTLLRHPRWRETLGFNDRAPLLDVASAVDGQKLLLAKAYLLADQNDAAAVRELLGNDVRFWREVLASSDILITKMVAVNVLNRHFTIGNLAIRRLPAQLQLAALPEQWTAPLTDDERSMLRCFTGEWIWSGEVYGRLASGVDSPFDTDGDRDGGFLDGVMNRASRPLFQLQDTRNRQAEMLVRASTALNVPIERFSASFDQAKQIYSDPIPGSSLEMLYNPMGNILLMIGSGGYEKYPLRVIDVEGVRRAAVLTTELRTRNVALPDIPVALDASQMRTPYSGEPFAWSAKERAIVFFGKAPGEHSRHAFKY